MSLFYKIVGTFFFIGNIRIMPGTFASIVGAIIWLYIPEDIYFRLLLILVTCLIGLISISYLLKDSDDPDPSYIVIDEIVGIWISCIFIQKEFIFIIIALLLFRYLDIIKPSFIYHVQSIKGSIGIMLDDILCGALVLLIFTAFSI